MTRPHRVLIVAGTATEVGKTWVAAELLRVLRGDGRTVAARKPAQSFERGDATPTDAEVLAGAAGCEPHEVCPPDRWYDVAMAPPMAAEVLGRPVPTIDELVAGLRWPDATVDIGLLETAGGVRSPLASDGDTVTLADRVAPDGVVLVADAGLGTINAVRLCTGALAAWPVVVFLNRFDAHDDLHRANAAWLRDRDGVHLATDVRSLADVVGSRPS